MSFGWYEQKGDKYYNYTKTNTTQAPNYRYKNSTEMAQYNLLKSR